METSAGTKSPPAVRIGRITPASGQITEFPLPTESDTGKIASGPDGNLWFTGDKEIGRITPDGHGTKYPLSAHSGEQDIEPGAITSGPDGNLWFTEGYIATTTNTIEAKIGRITPAGQITEFPLPTAATGSGG